MEKESSEVKEVKEGRAPTALMLQDVISLVFSQLTLSARDICILRRICTTWRKIIHASTKRISFEPGTRVSSEMLKLFRQFSSLFLDLNFTKLIADDEFAEILMSMDGLIGLDFTRVSNQEILRGYPLNLRYLHGIIHSGYAAEPKPGHRSFQYYQSKTNSILNLTRLQELTMSQITRQSGSFLSQMTTLNTLGISRGRYNEIDMSLLVTLPNLRTFRCALDVCHRLGDDIPCPLTQLLHLDTCCDYRNFIYRRLPMPDYYNGRNVFGPGKLTFPLHSYNLQSLNICPLLLFPAPSNPFEKLTNLTSLRLHFHAMASRWAKVPDATLRAFCTTLAPLTRLEKFRLCYGSGVHLDGARLLDGMAANGSLANLLLESNAIPPQIILNCFLRVHTLHAQHQPASILEALSNLEHLTKLSLPMLSHQSVQTIPLDLAPLGRLTSLRILKLRFLSIAGVDWHPTAYYYAMNENLRNAVENNPDFQNISYEFVSSLKHLRELDVHNRAVGDLALKNMTQLPLLSRLDLGFSNLSQKSVSVLQDLANFPALRTFSHHGTVQMDENLEKIFMSRFSRL